MKVDLDAILDALAERVAAKLTPKAIEFVDQRTCGIDAKAFVRAARAGEFAASKVGRLYIARQVDVIAWLDSRRVGRPSLVRVDEDREQIRAAILRPRKAG